MGTVVTADSSKGKYKQRIGISLLKNKFLGLQISPFFSPRLIFKIYSTLQQHPCFQTLSAKDCPGVKLSWQ